MFHVSLLRPFNKGLSFVPLPPDPIIQDGIPLYEVEGILSHRDKVKGNGKEKTRREYLIKWAGYGDVHNSWEPEANITVGNPVLVDYVYRLKHPVMAPIKRKTRGRKVKKNAIAN